jgi:hypothetical protein
VRVLAFHAAPKLDRQLGLIGWVAVLIDDWIKLDNITVRQTRDGRVQCFFAERRDSAGHRRRDAWPMHAWCRRAIEREILRQLSERAARHEKVLAP